MDIVSRPLRKLRLISPRIKLTSVRGALTQIIRKSC